MMYDTGGCFNGSFRCMKSYKYKVFMRVLLYECVCVTCSTFHRENPPIGNLHTHSGRRWRDKTKHWRSIRHRTRRTDTAAPRQQRSDKRSPSKTNELGFCLLVVFLFILLFDVFSSFFLESTGRTAATARSSLAVTVQGGGTSVSFDLSCID